MCNYSVSQIIHLIFFDNKNLIRIIRFVWHIKVDPQRLSMKNTPLNIATISYITMVYLVQFGIFK
jgi:hypothetical protein